jgi:dihydropteroate synthase
VNKPKLILKRLGVMNVTPNSFSDGGENSSLENFKRKLEEFSSLEGIDLGAESTAPANQSISWRVEWDRLKLYLPVLKNFSGPISIDTYHPETIEEILRFYQDNGLTQELIWNDVSGKFDHFARDFLSFSPDFRYVYCHNLAPTRELTGQHMDFVDTDLSLESLRDYFGGFKIPRIIFDPCLGFSKTYEQNWFLLENFHRLQEITGHDQWLLGLSRKSFLRKKFNLTLVDRDTLDQKHDEVIRGLAPKWSGEVWIRSHTFRWFL